MNEMKSEDFDRWVRFDIKTDPKYLEFRKRIILQKLQDVDQVPVHAGLLRLIRAASIAAALVVLFVMVRPDSGTTPTRPQQMAGASQEVPFALQKVNDLIQLSWKGKPGSQYRIYKGPTPAAMKPVESVKGAQWVDSAPDSNPITFYRVEAL